MTTPTRHARRAETIVVHREQHMYCSHPCIAALDNGEWLVAFAETVQRHPFLHPPSDPRYYTVVTRSLDRGSTWDLPRVAPSYDWYGVETPGIAQLGSGEVLLNHWRFRWYSLEQGYELWAAGQEVFVCDPVADPSAHAWRAALNEEDWERHPFPYVRADGGAFVHLSGDRGRTWSRTVPLDIRPYRGAFSPKGAVELPDGTVVLALGSADYDPAAATFVVHSQDAGRSWSDPVAVAHVPGLVFSEPSAAVLADRTLLVVSREETTGHLHVSRSADGGWSWSEPRPLPYIGYPGHAVGLADGRLLVVYGRRRPPYGIRATISDDGGSSWGDEIVVRDDLSTDNLGYPSAIEYEPGRLFIVYYAEDRTGVTCIQGTYLTL